MKIIRRILRVGLTSILVLFAGLLVYANWRKPSLGERIYMENPTQIVVLQFPESYTRYDSVRLTAFWQSAPGVSASYIGLASHTLCITIDPRKTSRADILQQARNFDQQLAERLPVGNRPECPVDLTGFQRLMYTLNIRK